MGRQSSRIYYNSKDHKDVYYNGKWHKAMYLGSTLLWEKLRKGYVSFYVEHSARFWMDFTVSGNITIAWGDGKKTEIFSPTIKKNVTHTYENPGKYELSIIGDLTYLDMIARTINYVTEILSTFQESAATQYVNVANNPYLKSVPEWLFDNFFTKYGIGGFFVGCGIKEVPAGLFKNWQDAQSFYQTFMGSALEKIPPDLFKNCESVWTFNQTFAFTPIEGIPPQLFDSCKNMIEFYHTFEGCTSVKTNVPELWKQFPNATGYGCFRGCINAANYDSIPEDWR